MGLGLLSKEVKMNKQAKAVLDYWFSDFDIDEKIDSESACVQRWFRRNMETDKEIKKLFEEDLKKAIKGEYDFWAEDAEGRLALTILLDQFPRNMYRNTTKAFSGDLKALELALRSIKDGFDGRVEFVERLFIYMPLMHSENLEVQELSLKYFTLLVEEATACEEINVDYLKTVLDYAQRHYDMIKEFGRFPHRNKVLRRRSTSDELAFLQMPNSSF